jgi:hypothetical protein
MSYWSASHGVLRTGALPGVLEVGRQPSFFVVGPPRTGTTWLHEVLCGRVVLPSPTKETRFFDTHYERGMDWYQSHFRGGGTGLCVGEIAPTYFASSEARVRIAALLPRAKVVCIFRNPVERALSLYRLKRAYGWIPWTFEEALRQDQELVESGKYATHFAAWQQMLGEGQVLATVYDDMRDRPQEYVAMLADFIGIPRFHLGEDEMIRIHASETLTHPRQYRRTYCATRMASWLKARRLDHVVTAVKKSPFMKLLVGGGAAFGDLSTDLTHSVYEQFRPEVERLEQMLKRNFSEWRPPALLTLPATCGDVSAPLPVALESTQQ